MQRLNLFCDMLAGMTSAIARTAFPALAGDWIFLENAGGSQVPGVVPDAISQYMVESYVQVGAGYPHSDRATATVERAHAFTEEVLGVGGAGRVILGPSTTQLLNTLAHAHRHLVKPGDQIVIAKNNHESNIGGWLELQEQGAEIVWWEVDPVTGSLSIENLPLSERTKLVCFPHVSNLVGEMIDVAEVTKLAHVVGAKVVVDGVAYAPHGPIQVESWGVDWYVVSAYKIYGPHFAALFGRHEALNSVTGPNHFFISKNSFPYKFELGCLPHELLAGWLALRDYFDSVGGFANMRALELPVIEKLHAYLSGRSDVRLLGPAGTSNRVGTFSFVHDSISSASIARRVQDHRIAIRHGHMYAYRLCQDCSIDPEDGVVRISAVHTNTVEEIDRLSTILDSIFES